MLCTAFASLAWFFGANVPLSYVVGAVMGVSTGGLAATPLVQVFFELRRRPGGG